MDIPYNLIHELESEYGSIVLVPESNDILKSIRKKLHIRHAKRTNFSYDEFKEEKIIEYLKEGYSIYETAQLTQSSYAKVRKLKSNHELKTLPRFKYVAVGSDFNVYSKGVDQYKAMCPYNVHEVNYAKKSLLKIGFKLVRANGYFHWCDIKPDDQYIVDYEIYTK